MKKKKSLIKLGIGLICLGFGIKYTNSGIIDVFRETTKASKQQENKVEE